MLSIWRKERTITSHDLAGLAPAGRIDPAQRPAKRPALRIDAAHLCVPQVPDATQSARHRHSMAKDAPFFGRLIAGTVKANAGLK